MKDSRPLEGSNASIQVGERNARRDAIKAMVGAAVAAGGLTQLSRSADAASRPGSTTLEMLDEMAVKPRACPCRRGADVAFC